MPKLYIHVIIFITWWQVHLSDDFFMWMRWTTEITEPVEKDAALYLLSRFWLSLTEQNMQNIKSLFLLPMQLVSYPLNNPTSGCKALTIAQLFNKPSDRDLSLTLTEGKELMANKLCLELSHSSLMAWSSFTVLMPTAMGTIYFTWTNL